MSRKYKNPPINEAVCEFQFGQDSSWDLAVPGLVYEKVRATFPKRSQIAQVALGISTVEGEIGQQFGAMPIARFSNEDETILLQIGSHFLSVNHLKPYSSWEDFLPLIQESFNAYRDVANPKSIHRIGLRYINTIQVVGEGINLDDYFEFRPYVGPALPHTIGPFMMSVQLPFENSRDILNLRLASVAGISSDIATIILDLDYFLVEPGKIGLDEAFSWVDAAHTHIEEAFEAAITDRLREMFEE